LEVGISTVEWAQLNGFLSEDGDRVLSLEPCSGRLVVLKNSVILVSLNGMHWLLGTANVPSSPILATLMMEAIHSSKTLVVTRVTWHNIPEDDILHSHCRENLKSYIGNCNSMEQNLTTVHRNPPLDPIMDHVNPIHIVMQYLFKLFLLLPLRLQDHINIEASRLLNVSNITRRLKGKKPFELVIH
jgi:hypothetical protein